MNKISKKIVSLVTMAAFALTLVPVAAFAANPTLPTVAGSNFTVESKAANQLTVTVNLDGDDLDLTQVGIKFAGLDEATPSYDAGTTYAGDGNGQDDTAVVETTDKQVVVTYDNVAAGSTKVEVTLTPDGTGENNGWGVVPVAKNGADVATVYDSAAVAGYSYYGVMDNSQIQKTAEVAVDTDLTTEFRIGDTHYDGIDGVDFGPAYVWATQAGKDTAVKLVGDNVEADGSIKVEKVYNGDELNVQFGAAGTYDLHAGFGATLEDAQEHELLGTTTVTVTDDVVADSLTLDLTADANGTPVTMTYDKTTNTYKLDLTGTNFGYNGIDKITLNGFLGESDGTPAKYQVISLKSDDTTVVEFKDNFAKTENNGKFSGTFTMQDQKNVYITLVDEETGLECTVRVIAAKAYADDINRTLTDGYVLAGNDATYADSVYGTATAPKASVSLADAVQFEVLDQKDNAMTGEFEGIKDVKVDIRAKGNGSKITNADLDFIWDADAGVYTLAYVGQKAKQDLVPGKYEVRVALPGTDDNATVTFNVAKFGKVQDTVLAITARDYDKSPANPNEEVMTVDDTITLGQQITVNAKYVDENGLKVPTDDVVFNFNGKAVSDWFKWNNRFATEMDIPANESLIGTTVKVVAFNTANKQLVEKTLTVADSYSDKSLEFSTDNGAISKDNTVKVSVVNADGKVQQVEGYMTAWVADQSNEDAKVSVEVNREGAHAVQNGKGTLTVYSDKETTADIVVVVKAGTEAYYGTLEYTFGSADSLANRTVVMTIDSTEYVVNNNIITGDAAPYIDSNWRTMVPIRALAEAFDAEVIWNQDDETVTINFDGDTTIVMTVGETTYTVDGNEATMDTEPVNTGSRVYVPVRFAAEGLGFGVTPLYNDAGLTASVVFQK